MHFVAEPVIVIGRLRDQSQEHEQPKPQAPQKAHPARGQDIFVRDMHMIHLCGSLGRSIASCRAKLVSTPHVRLLHETEA